MTTETARRVRRALDGDRTVTVTRAFPLDDIRIVSRADGGDGRTVEAYAAVFMRPTEIWDQDGHYNEQISPAAFDNTLTQRRGNIFCLYNHGKTLGNTPSDRWSVPIGRPVDMRTDAKGWLTWTRYNEDPDAERILEAVRSGSLKGMSFTGVFLRSDPELRAGHWSQYGPDDSGALPLVTRLEIAAIEYGPTPIPAYDDAQIVGVRSRVEEAREQATLLTPRAITPQLAAGPGVVHPDVHATPEHRTAPLVTPDDPAEAQWDSQQAENAMAFPADLAHMHSLYALYDTAGEFADGSFAKSAGHLPHHVVDENGTPGPHHPDAVRACLDMLPALPIADEQRDAARAHLQAHLQATSGETGATNGDGNGTLASHVPTSSSGRDDEDEQHDRTDQPGDDPGDPDRGQPAKRTDTWTGQMTAADEYAQAVLEITADGPVAAAAFAASIMGQLAPDRGGDAPGDGKLPYGHVEYADPGYQEDGKKRYPIDEKHIEAAWSYINQSENADKYSPAHLAEVKGKIKAAMKKFGHAVTEDSDGDGKKATSSSGRQPAAQDQQDRDGHADTDGQGTGPQTQERTEPDSDAAPLTHPAPPEDSTSTGSMHMDGPQKTADRSARVTAIQERMAAIHTLHTDGDLPEELATEWTALEAERTGHLAAIKDSADRAAMIAGFTAAGAGAGQGQAPVPGQFGETAPDPGFDGGGGEQSRSKFGAPQFMPQVDRSSLYDLASVRSSVSHIDDLPRAYRDRAMKILELDGRGFPRVRYSPLGEGHITRTLTMEDAQSTVANLLDTVDDERGVLARRIMVTGNPVYERAFGKALTQLSIVGLNDEESRALSLGVDPQGGYAVPFQLDPTVILTSNGAINPIRHLARVETITGKEWDGVTSAGVTVTRANENAEVGTGDAAFVQPTVRTTRVQGFVPFSVELDVSWGALRSQMTALLMDAKDIEEASAFMTGNGTAPNATGLLTGISSDTAAVGTASTVTAAGSASLAVGDLYSLENAMPARFRQQSAYLASRTIYNRFRQLFQALASAAFDSWVRPSGGQPATFNGYPAYEVSTMTGAISSGSRVLVQGDYRQFLIVDRIGMGIELVPHLFGPTNRYPTGQRGILAIWFNNSQVLVPNAFRLLQTG